MIYTICYTFLAFLFYSVLGYIVEVISCSIIERKWVWKRGFCLGPYLPIYGISCLLMTWYLTRYENDPIVLFVMSALVCTIMEYITSYILEKIFKVRWWDYSEKRFNIAGRVCLENALLFGIGGMVCIYLINPILMNLLQHSNQTVILVLSIILGIIFLTDVTITVITLGQVKVASKKFKNKDATSEVSQLVRQEIIKNSALIRHMLNALPKIDINKAKNPIANVKAYLQEKYLEKRKNKKKV